jgi:hypothetical protein
MRAKHSGFGWGKAEGRRPRGTLRRRWKNNIEVGREEIGWVELI